MGDYPLEVAVNAISILANQFSATHQILHDLVNRMTDVEWVTRPASGANLIGYTLWHVVRTQDYVVNTLIQGIPEVISESRWEARGSLNTPGTGDGFSPEDCDEIAYAVKREDLLDYADQVDRSIQTWLNNLPDARLDDVPDIQQHLAPYPAYQGDDFLAEIEYLNGQPAWRLLIGLALGHVREHFGEVSLLQVILRREIHANLLS
jgi:hypothetical protein